MQTLRLTCLYLIVIGLLVACDGANDTAPTEPLPTSAATATDALPPTETPLPTETFTPAPTVPGRATLPPTWTPAPAGAEVDAPIGSGFNITPDQLVFSALLNVPNESVWVINEDQTSQRRVLVGAANPSWSPTGDRMVLTVFRLDGSFDVVTVAADGRGEFNLTSDNPGSDLNPLWSPDGTRIAFQADRDSNGQFELYTIGVEGTNGVQVSTIPAGDGGFDWSPDSTRLVFVSNGGPIEQELYVTNADGSGQQQLTANSSADNQPDWSPDGSLIAYRCGTDICTIAPDGSSQQTVAALGAFPRWSPDGTRIAYDCTGLCIIDAAGGEAQIIVPDVSVNTLDWSPDSTRIAYTTTGPNFGLYVVTLETGAVTELVIAETTINSVTWNPIMNE